MSMEDFDQLTEKLQHKNLSALTAVELFLIQKYHMFLS